MDARGIWYECLLMHQIKFPSWMYVSKGEQDDVEMKYVWK